MEDFLQILITFGIIIFAATSNLRKRARTLEEETEELPSEETPTNPGPFTPIPKPRVRPTERKAAEALHPDSQELLTPEIALKERPKAHKNKIATTGRHLHPQGSSLKTASAPARPEEEPTSRHPLTADFDPQKAIIWAEIMNPKFEE